MQNLNTLVKTVFWAIFIFSFPAAAEDWIKDENKFIGRYFCPAIDPNQDCPWVYIDEKANPQSIVVASRDINGDYYVNPAALAQLWYVGGHPQFAERNIVELEFASNFRLTQEEESYVVEVTKADLPSICAVFDSKSTFDMYTGFFPMMEQITLENGKLVRMYGPTCIGMFRPTDYIRKMYAEVFDSEPLMSLDTAYPLTFIGQLQDGLWYIDYSLLDENGLLDKPIPFAGIELPLIDLLSCRPENETRRGCQNTVATFIGGEAGIPFISLVRD